MFILSMKKSNLASSAEKINASNEDDDIPSAAPLSTARPTTTPTIHHQPLRMTQNQRQEQRAYREFDGGWMKLPNVSNCPAGLEYLATIDQLLVCQQLEDLESQIIYYARERSHFCARNCCRGSRAFTIHILDQFQNEVIRLDRPMNCDSCRKCRNGCLDGLEVYSPTYNFIGSIKQEMTIWIPFFEVKNGAGDTVLRIQGPCCTTSCFNDLDFKILSGDGSQQIGVITKQWSGLAREWLTDADYFGITFPMDLDVEMKAVMLGACFLILRAVAKQRALDCPKIILSIINVLGII